MTKKNFKYKRFRWLLFPLLALLTFALTEILHKQPHWTEQVYSRSIYPAIASFLSTISSLVPFSLDDLFYLVLVLFVLSLLALLLIKKLTWKKAAKWILITAALGYSGFYFLWGFNYFRQDLNTRLHLEISQPGSSDYYRVLETLVAQTNNSWAPPEDFGKEQTGLLVENALKKLAPALQIDYPAGKRRAKNITFSGFFAQAGISGYYGPFFNEIHLNGKLLPMEYPFVLAHEKTHQLGITSEAEANFLAWLVCTQSESRALRYSANLAVLRYFLYQGRGQEKVREIAAHLDKRVIGDLKRISQHWRALRNEKIDRAATKVNDAYLTTNKIEKGIRDYTGVVKYVLDYSMDQKFQQKIKTQ